MFLIINFANWFERSSAAVPFPTILVLLFVYSALSVPNVWLGAFIGFKKTTIKNPGKINKLSRDIPPQPWYLRMKILVPMGGIVPFVAVFIELLYIM
jgi:transmembrane 9 superfamily protein 2/4